MKTSQVVLALRDSIGITQATLAKRIQVAIATVSRWESDERQPNREALRRLAKVASDYRLKPLAELFEAQRKAAIATRISKLPSAGTGRHVSLIELRRIFDGIGVVAEKIRPTLPDMSRSLEILKDELEPYIS